MFVKIKIIRFFYTSRKNKKYLSYLYNKLSEILFNYWIINCFRALEEIFFAYNWMLQNFPALGTSGKFILVGGDSAGGNFSVGLTLMCMKNGIRLPDSLILMYPALLCQMYPSPSRWSTCRLVFGCWITWFISSWERNNCLISWANSQNNNHFYSKWSVLSENSCHFVNSLIFSSIYFLLNLR